MTTRPDAIALDTSRAFGRVLRDYIALTKPRVVAMVLVTATVGYYLGSSGAPDYVRLLAMLVGVGLAGGGTLALNQYLERDLDARMRRTSSRPLPAGRLQPIEALAFGAAVTAAGLIVLVMLVNSISALVTATTVISYLWLYTPLKRTTPLCSLIGAVPGALPPVSGWVAASGSLEPGACVLFAILFLWQVPHSLAVAQLYADDYARAGFRLLPVVDRDGYGTERQILANSVALLGVGLLPTLLGVTGTLYFVAAFLLGSGFLLCGVWSVRTPSPAGPRRLLFASLLYLPVLLACMALDKVPL
jgi:protoheme IX farnesyltransferase